MQSRYLQHVSVWLDTGASDESVVPQAMEWAFRLSLPIRAAITPPQVGIGRDRGSAVEKMKMWGTACGERGIVLEWFLSSEDSDAAMDQFLRPHGLCVIAEDSSSAIHAELLLQSAESGDLAILACPRVCIPMSRILVVCPQTRSDATFMESVARLCLAVEIQPIILIVASTEREAHLRQGYVEGVCSSLGLLVDCDFVVGCDLRSAVSRVANWLSCSHVIIERQRAGAWWQLANGNPLDQLRGLSDSLSILALPEGIAMDVPRRVRSKGLSLNGNTAAHSAHKSDKVLV